MDMESKLGSHVYLKTEHLAELSPTLKKRLKRGRQDVSNICKLIAKSARVSTLPPVEILDQFWMTKDGGRINGRANILAIDGNNFSGVQLPAPTAICKEFSVVRAILVHEFAHCFDLIKKVLKHDDSGSTDTLHLPRPKDLFKDEKHDMDVLGDPADWFGDEDVSNFIHWGDARLDLLDPATLIVAEDLEPVLPSMAFKAEGLSIPDEYVDHIRSLQKKEEK